MNKDEMRDGAAAEALLANPMLIAAFDNTEAQIVNQMRASGFKDSETHHRLVLALQMLHAIRRNIETTIETGQMARFEIEKPSVFKRMLG